MSHNGPNRAPCAGRNKTKCEWYRKMRRRELNHIRRIERHMKRYKDSSPMAREALAKYQELAKV